MMKEDEKMEENISKREVEAHVSLQKVIRLDCKDSNFHFRDEMRNVQFKVYNSHSITQLAPGDHLLRQYWRHIQTHYFKKLEYDEMSRLHYIKSIFSSSQSLKPVYCVSNRFWESMETIMHPDYLQEQLRPDVRSLDGQNWLKTMYIRWQMMENINSKRQLRFKQTQLDKCKQLTHFYKKSKKYHNSLKEQSRILSALITQQNIQQPQQDQLSSLINRLELELQENCTSTKKIVQKLSEAVNTQKDRLGKAERQSLQNQPKGANASKKLLQKKKQGLSLRDNLESIQFIIVGMEERQVAESICKIQSVEKIDNETYFLVTFESAMNLAPKLMSERHLERMNSYREYPLDKFYRTGIKSLYSYICNNYVGFRELYQNRSGMSRFKDKDMFQLMKKGAKMYASQQIAESFQRFQMCHHCKFLYPDYLLLKCKFQSDRQVMPKLNGQSSYEPDFTQIQIDGLHLVSVDVQKNRVSQRFMTRRKNCLTGYAKINQQYVCKRQYCLSCLKDNYAHQGMRESGLCPFCKGVCLCSRCSRNAKVVKFKNLYSILGGNMSTIQNNCYFDQFFDNEESVAHKGRGRPKKAVRKPSHISINRGEKKMRNTQMKENFIGITQLMKKGRRGFLITNKKEQKQFSIIQQKALKAQFSLKKQLLQRYSTAKTQKRKAKKISIK